MKRVNDNELLKILFERHKIDRYFETDIKDDVYLVKFEKNETIQSTGDQVDVLYFLVDGSVKVNKSQMDGKSKMICIVNAFDMLGDIEIFADMDYVNDIVALKDTYCLGLNLTMYKEILLADPIFVKYMAKSLAKIVLLNNESSSFNMLNSLETRVATYILLSAKNKCFRENLTHLAEQLATSYRHLLRVLSGLCDKNILKKEGRDYIIVDENKLKEMSDQTVTHI